DPTPFPQTDSENVPAPVRPGLRTAFLLHCRVVSVAMGLLLVTSGSFLQGDPRPNAKQDRIAGLVSQLGDAKYVKREAAMKRLKAIGDPALAALRKALAANDDPEIRRRALQVIRTLAGRKIKKELKRFQGTWILVSHEQGGQITRFQDNSLTITITRNKWVTRSNGGVQQAGWFEIVDIFGNPRSTNVTVLRGFSVGATSYGVFHLKGDTLKYCFTDSGPGGRPVDFTTRRGDNRCCLVWKKTK